MSEARELLCTYVCACTHDCANFHCAEKFTEIFFFANGMHRQKFSLAKISAYTV